MAHAIYADMTASVTELKKNPMGTVQAGKGHAVAILNRNEPAFYCVPADVYEELMELMDDLELARIIEERKDDEVIPVSLDEL